MDYDSLKRLKGALKGHPKEIIGFKPGKPAIRMRMSRAALNGLKNFMPETLQQALEENDSSHGEALEEALRIIRALNGCTRFCTVHSKPTAIKQ